MSSPETELYRLAFIGGTGPEGRGLALRFARQGHAVIIGSRSRERAQEAAEDLRRLVPEADAAGAENSDAAAGADLVFLTIPYSGVKATLPSLADATRGKIVVSAVAPIEFREGRPVPLNVEAGSAAQEVQALLPEARVVSAFQTIDAHQLQNLDLEPDTDVIVCSDDVEARRTLVRLASSLPGVRGLSGGRLAASRYVEEITGLLITINRIYKVHSGVRITGVNR
jgi:NADPH-dependent F420 reductase